MSFFLLKKSNNMGCFWNVTKNNGCVDFMDERTIGVVVRILPNCEQREGFHRNFGCVRKAYNETLGKYNALYEKDDSIQPTYTFLNKLMMESKKELPYLDAMESTSLQQAVRDLSHGFDNFLKNPHHFNYPKFHSKKENRNSFRQTIPANKKIIDKNKLSLRIYGEVRFRTSPEYHELLNRSDIKFNNITIAYDGIHYYAIINITTDYPEQLPLTGDKIGCDINSNINGWLVTSDEVKEFFDINHENQMIKHVNRLMSKCRKLSRRWKKLQKRLQKWYNKRTHKLNDYIEKLTYNLVKDYDTIVFEENYATIKILIGGEQNMVFPLSQFIQRLKNKFEVYKPDVEGVVFVDAKNTSKTCHHCGHINKDLDVKTRNWICPKCGEELDRDVNAAINILNRWCPGDSLENTQ